MEITRNEKTISVASNYNPTLPGDAKKLGGKWNPGEKVWTFDIRDENRVEALYRNIYGEWDTENEVTNLVNVKITATDDISKYCSGIFFGGRQLARATGRDSGATLGQGVILLSGIATSGGSINNWQTCINKNSVFEVKDIPLTQVEKEDLGKVWKIEILGDIDIDKMKLETEKTELLKRLNEINELLKEN
jgi:hypothetical protein